MSDNWAPSAPSPSPWSAWADAVDPAGQRYIPTANWLGDPQFFYGATNPDPNAVTYDATPGPGDPYGSFATEYGSNITNYGIDQWLNKTHPEQGYTSGSFGSSGNAGTTTSLGGAWGKVDGWNTQIQTAVQQVAQQTGVFVPINLVKSIMQEESGGVPTGTNSSGANGLMQITQSTAGNYDWNKVTTDPAYNIYAGVNELALHYLQGDPNTGAKSWEWAAREYHGVGWDGNTTDQTYWDAVNNNWQQLTTGADKNITTGSQAAAGTTAFSSIYGGIDAAISQPFGMTPFAQQQIASGPNNEYAYTDQYTLDHQPMGHAGVDVAVNYGTHLYAPAAGQISIIGSADGQNYFYTNQDDQRHDITGPGMGELAVTEANGDVYILGHMSQITGANGNFKVGDYVKAGDFVGFSGQNNGAHVHIEYRRLDPAGAGNGPGQTGSGYIVVDPQQAFAGNFTGAYGAGGTQAGPTPAAQSNNWQDYLQAAILGNPLSSMSNDDPNSFHTFLRQFQLGNDPTHGQNSQSNSLWSWANGGTATTGQAGPGGPPSTQGGQGIVNEAQQYLGVKYVLGQSPGITDNPYATGWDCSGYVKYLNSKYGDGQLPQGSHYQYQYAQQHGLFGTNGDTSQLQVGDIMFFDTTGGTPDPASNGGNLNNASHVGIYIGNGKMISAMNPQQGTTIAPIDAMGGPFIGAMHASWR